MSYFSGFNPNIAVVLRFDHGGFLLNHHNDPIKGVSDFVAVINIGNPAVYNMVPPKPEKPNDENAFLKYCGLPREFPINSKDIIIFDGRKVSHGVKNVVGINSDAAEGEINYRLAICCFEIDLKIHKEPFDLFKIFPFFFYDGVNQFKPKKFSTAEEKKAMKAKKDAGEDFESNPRKRGRYA